MYVCVCKRPLCTGRVQGGGTKEKKHLIVRYPFSIRLRAARCSPHGRQEVV